MNTAPWLIGTVVLSAVLALGTQVLLPQPAGRVLYFLHFSWIVSLSDAPREHCQH